jgi:hypothetical protein
MIYKSGEPQGGMILTWENKELGEKPVQCHFIHHYKTTALPYL